MYFCCQQEAKTIRIKMELADRAVGFLLSFISLSIFTYYTFWVIILVSNMPSILNVLWLPYFNFLISLLYCALSALCRWWSFRTQVLLTPRICHINTCFCWCCSYLPLMHIYWVRDAEIQEEEGIMYVVFLLHNLFWCFKTTMCFL